MVIRVGINGFGRIGRIIFRKCIQNNDLQISAINDPAVDIDYICYLIKFDSTHGRFNKDLMFTENEIIIEGIKIQVFHEKMPSSIPWQAAGVQYVVEASGMFSNHEKASGHLASESVKRVIVTAPTVDIPMLIIGVNEDKISTEQKVISCASSTLYCLAPLIKILDDNYGVVEGFITSIHAMTPSLKPLDGLCLRGKHWRDHRSIHQNIIPAATGACKALGKIIPRVKDKMSGIAFRVPIVNVSVLDLTIRLNKNTTIVDIIKRIDNESRTSMKNVIKTSNDEAVSSDFLGDVNSCILDQNSSLQLTPNFFKLICWYENEYSYACRVVDSITYSEKSFHLKFISKIRNELFLSNKLFHERNAFVHNDNVIAKHSYNIQNKAKIILSTSQENDFKAKLQNQQSKTKRAFLNTSLNKEKDKNEIFEIWNDDEKGQKQRVNENIEPLYHSCVAFTPNKVSNFSKSQKFVQGNGELIKMIHKTDNLSTENNHNEYQDDYLENEIKKEKIEDFKVNMSSKNNPMCGDCLFRNIKRYQPVLKTNIQKSDKNCLSVTLNESKIRENELKSQKESINNKLIAEEDKLINQSPIPMTKNNKEGTVILDNAVGSHQSLAENDKRENINSQSIVIVPPDFFPSNDLSNVTSNEVIQNTPTQNKGPDYDVNYTIEIEIVKTFEPCTFNEINVENNTSTDLESNTNSTDNRSVNSKEDLQKKVLKGIINSLSVGMALVETDSRNLRAVNTNTTISNGDRGRTFSDIYEKLDSASGTDSENSFQIKERKSQVLTVADLKTSVENLARLDKICKIIEISDELSDKLFSALNSNNQDFERKNWSLKDLCERLKLDEFCNNVFGQ